MQSITFKVVSVRFNVDYFKSYFKLNNVRGIFSRNAINYLKASSIALKVTKSCYILSKLTKLLEYFVKWLEFK